MEFFYTFISPSLKYSKRASQAICQACGTLVFLFTIFLLIIYSLNQFLL